MRGHPPFEGEDEEEYFDEVEGGYEDVFVGGADELHGFEGEEGHVFVGGVVGDVGVGAVVEGDEDVEEDFLGSMPFTILLSRRFRGVTY